MPSVIISNRGLLVIMPAENAGRHHWSPFFGGWRVQVLACDGGMGQCAPAIDIALGKGTPTTSIISRNVRSQLGAEHCQRFCFMIVPHAPTACNIPK